MENSATLNQAITIIKQLSLADQKRLWEWFLEQFKEAFLSTHSPQKTTVKAAESDESNSLESLLAQVTPDNLHSEMNTGLAIGQEAW